jgi:4-amino-4-deoxy-L-arabinose transferase-like glycosyltransferase
MRLTSAAMAGLTAMFTALLILELLPGRRTLALAGGLMVAFQPMFSFIGGAVNNDNGVNLLAICTLYVAVRALRRGLTPGVALLLGVSLAITPLMKGTGYAIYPAVGLAIAGALIRRHSRVHLLGGGVFVLAFAAIYVGWDLVRESFGRTQFTTPGGGTPGVSFGALDYPRAYLV